MKESIQMANNCLYSRPCLKSEMMCATIANKIFTMVEPRKRRLCWGTKQSGSGGRQLLFGLSNVQLFLLTLLRTFLCLCLEKRPQGKTESFQNACTSGFHFHFRQVPCLSSGMATIKRELAYDQQRLTSFFRKRRVKWAVGLRLRQQV